MLEKRHITRLGLSEIEQLKALINTATDVAQLNAVIEVINTEINLILDQSYGPVTVFHDYISSRATLRTDAQDAISRLQV